MYERQPNDTKQYEVVEGGAPAVAPARWRDNIHWGSVWAGLTTAVAVFLLLQTLFYWLGALSIRVTGSLVSTGPTNTWLSALLALVSLFFGGWMAACCMQGETRAIGALNGFMVWTLGTLVILVMSSFGLGMAFGAIGDAFNQYVLVGHGIGSIRPFANVEQVRAGWAFWWLIASACAATLGGWVGVSTPVERPVRTLPHGATPHPTA
jgi:hypothetical protein